MRITAIVNEREWEMIDREMAENAADVISTAAANLTKTKCQVNAIELSNKRDAFWLVIRVGIYPFYIEGGNYYEWYEQVAGKREKNYSHLLRLRIPETVFEGDSNLKLRQIGGALGDIWFESRYFSHLREDRQYIIPHLETTKPPASP